MLLYDLARISFKQLYRNRRRYKSVMLGIALGIAGLMIVFTMGNSVESDLGRNLELLGSATIIKATWDFDRARRWHHGQYYEKDIDGLRKLDNVSSVSPIVWGGHTFASNNKKINGRLMGVEENFFETLHLPVDHGRKITKGDVQEKASVCVVGKKIIDFLFPGVSAPLGGTLSIGGNMFTIVGITGGVEDPDFFQTVMIPMSVARSRFANMHEIRDIYIRAVNWDSVPQIQSDASALLKKNHPGYAEGVDVKFFPERIKTIQNAVLLVKIFLLAAAAVTLILAGIGITNVMLAAVRERTTEIGLKKAIGATEKNIVRQFLLESVTISVFGAFFGILFGTVSIELLKQVFQTVPNYSVLLLSLIGGVVFSAVLGILSGIIPARKAGKLDVADAMRFE